MRGPLGLYFWIGVVVYELDIRTKYFVMGNFGFVKNVKFAINILIKTINLDETIWAILIYLHQ